MTETITEARRHAQRVDIGADREAISALAQLAIAEALTRIADVVEDMAKVGGALGPKDRR